MCREGMKGKEARRWEVGSNMPVEPFLEATADFLPVLGAM